MSSLRLPRFNSLVVLAFGLGLASPALTAVLPVSPGAADRVVEVPSACPAFSWSGTEGAVAYELAVFDLGDSDNPALAYSRRIEGAALAWAPSRAECLAPGRVYAWLVRADVAGKGLGEWSAPRRFRVPGVPSIEEVDAALALLERWRAAQPGAAGGAAATAADRESASKSGDRASAETDAPLATGVAAIRGEIPDVTGSAFGVLGITGSPQGAGVVARNQSTGPDLVLDGEAQGKADTLLSETAIDRPSASAQSFSFLNTGAGTMTLQVDGTPVSLAGHPHAGEAITSGTVADGRVAATLARDDEVLGLVLASDGAGSGLDADRLDGLHAAGFQTSISGACPDDEAMVGVGPGGEVLCRPIPVPPILTHISPPFPAVLTQGPSLAILPDGRPVLAGRTPTSQLVVLRCNDPACMGPEDDEWAEIVDDPDNLVGDYTSIAIGTDGNPVVAYYDETAGNLKFAWCNDPRCDGGDEIVQTLDASANDVGRDPSVAIAGNGYPVMSYSDVTAHDIKLVACYSASCAARHLETIDTMGETSSLAIGTDGRPVIAFYTFGSLKVVKCENTGCSARSESWPGGQGRGPSIAIGADGFPVISHWDGDAQTLLVTKCDDSACAHPGESVSVVADTGTSLNVSTSIAVAADGLPVVAFMDKTAESLRVARCQDPACAGADATIATILTPSGVRRLPSIEIGADGFPVMTYESWRGVELVKCMSPTCLY